MKTKLALLLLLLAGSSLPVFSAPLSPVILAHRGQPVVVQGDSSSPLAVKQAITAGSIIETDKAGKVAVAVAPGQMVVLGSRTKLKVVSIHDAATSQGAVLELLVGVASCYIDPKHGHSGPVFALVAGKETITAKGTTWTTSKSGGGTVSTTVTSSTVTVTTAGGAASFPVSAGSVVTSTYNADGSWSGSVVVNLVTGLVTTYAAGDGSTTGTTDTASPTQLSSAATSFQAALDTGAASPTGGAEAAALAALAITINATLSTSGVSVSITTDGSSTGDLITDTGTDTRDTITAVSPENP